MAVTSIAVMFTVTHGLKCFAEKKFVANEHCKNINIRIITEYH